MAPAGSSKSRAGRLSASAFAPIFPNMQDNPIHVIGGGLAGQRGRLADRPRRRAVVLHEMRPCGDRGAQDRRAWPSSSAPIRSAPTMPQTMPSACCTRRCAALGSLIMAAADAHKVPAGGALAVDRDDFSAARDRRARTTIR